MNIEDKFELLRFKFNPDYDILIEVLEEVKKFIIKKKLILKGGMSMEFALQLNGKRLYSDENIPDYDFYSPNHYEDAYELAKYLCDKGYPNVQVINAMHLSTSKVRVELEPVADITYVPQDVYDNLRYLEYKSVRVLHPHYTIMDQFSSLCRPFDNPPYEVIFDRWEKDNKRLKLMIDNYPFPKPDKKYNFTPINISKYHDIIHNSNNLVTGWLAVRYYQEELDEKKINIPNIDILSYDPFTKISDKKQTKFYNPTISFPRHYTKDILTCYDIEGIPICLGSSEYKKNNKILPRVVSLPALMWHFINRWLYFNDEYAINGINETLEIISNQNELELKLLNKPAMNETFMFQVRKVYNKKEGYKVPRNVYFDDECSNELTKFKYENNHYFTIDGSELTQDNEDFHKFEHMKNIIKKSP